MKTINEIRAFTATPEYGKTFWNAMRIKHNAEAEMHVRYHWCVMCSCGG